MPSMIPAIAQITYASVDQGVGVGGWQVIQRVGELTAAQFDAIARRMPTAIDATIPIPDYRVPGLPVRMSTGNVPDSTAVAVWHAVPAGRDATGRPGNVFTHCAVFGDYPVRLPTLWGSPAWLAPFGSREVRAARLGDSNDIDVPDDWLENMTAFLFDPQHWRIGTLALIVDALSAALAGGPCVVLEVADAAEGAAWITSASVCTDWLSSQQIRFSTWERANDATRWTTESFHLVCVPHVDHGVTQNLDKCVVINTSELPDLGEWHNQPHLTQRGDNVLVTPWSVALVDQCSRPDDFKRVVSNIDTLRDEFPDARWQLDWPIAFTAFSAGQGAMVESAEVLAKATLDEIAQRPERLAVVVDALDLRMGQTMDSKWEAFEQFITFGASPLILGMAATVFMRNIADGIGWLNSLPELPRVDAASGCLLAPETAYLIATRLSEFASPDPWPAGHARASIFFIDLLVQLGWDVDMEITPTIMSTLSRIVELLRDDGSEIMETLSTLNSGTQQHIVAALLACDVLPSPKVICALGLDSIEFLEGSQAWLGSIVHPVAAAAADIVFDTPEYPLELRRQARYLLLFEQFSSSHLGSGFRVLTATEPALSATQLGNLYTRFGRDKMPEQFIAEGLVACVDDPDFEALQQQIAASEDSTIAQFAKAIGLLTGDDPLQFGLRQLVDAIENIRLMNLAPELLRLPDRALQVGNLTSLAAILILGVAKRQPFPGPPPIYFNDMLVAAFADSMAPHLDAGENGLASQIALWLALYRAGSPTRYPARSGRWVDEVGASDGSPSAFQRIILRLAEQRDVKLDLGTVELGVERAATVAGIPQDPKTLSSAIDFVTECAIDMRMLSRVRIGRAKMSRGLSSLFDLGERDSNDENGRR